MWKTVGRLAWRRVGPSSDFLGPWRDLVAREGGYDLDVVGEYCALTMLGPTRRLLVVIHQSSAQPVGIIDFMELSPSGLLPRIGLVLIEDLATGAT
jgi:hypothetical protein